MSEPGDTSSKPVGEGASPGTAAVGTHAWAIHTAIESLLATNRDPLRAAARREMISKFEICAGLRVCGDYIQDCFTEGNPSHGDADGNMHPVGSLRWTVERAIREIVAKGEDPRKATARRAFVQSFEVMQGKTLTNDEISDFFTNATYPRSDRASRASFDLPSRELNRLSDAIEPYGEDPLTGPPHHLSGSISKAGSVSASNQPSTMRINSEEPFPISLRSDAGTRRDADMVMARYRDGSRNFITRNVAKRQNLVHLEPNKVRALAGMNQGDLHVATWIELEIPPDDTGMPDVLLSRDFKISRANLDIWDITAVGVDADIPIPNRARRDSGRSGRSSASKGSDCVSQSHRQSVEKPEWLDKAFDSLHKLVVIAELSSTGTSTSKDQDQDSGYSSLGRP